MRKTIDALVATFCIARGHTLVYSDRDFDGFEQFPGLRVRQPQARSAFCLEELGGVNETADSGCFGALLIDFLIADHG
jgi:hypothetical protein